MPRVERDRVQTALLRGALRDALARSSFRQLGKEIGISPMGLHRLLAGAEPQARTRAKLEAWYVRDAADRNWEVDATTAAAALRLLAAGLEEKDRHRAIRSVLKAWESAYDTAGTPRPAWLTEMSLSVGRDQR